MTRFQFKANNQNLAGTSLSSKSFTTQMTTATKQNFVCFSSFETKIIDEIWISGCNGGIGGGVAGNNLYDNSEYPVGRFLLVAAAFDEDEYYEEEVFQPNIDLKENYEKETFENVQEYKDKDYGGFERSEFYVAEISAPSLPVGKGIPSLDDLTAGLKTQIGFPGNRSDLSEDLLTLTQTGMFESVEAEMQPHELKGKNNPVQVIFKFTPFEYPRMESFRVEGASILPKHVAEEVMSQYKSRGGGKVDMSTIYLIKNIIEGFYQERGFIYSGITSFEGWESGHPLANVTEGRVQSVKVIPVDDLGNTTEKTAHNLQAIEQEVRNIIKEGELFSVGEARKALRVVLATQMFESSRLLQKLHDDHTQNHLIDVEVLVKERPAKNAEIELVWQVEPGNKGNPMISDLAPGGSLLFENRNIGGKGTRLSAVINYQDLFHIEGITDIKIDFKAPYCFGIDDPKRRTFEINAFQTRKRSSVFSSINAPEAPYIEVDRAGSKFSLIETNSCNRKGTMSLVAESISCRDESGALCAKAHNSPPGSESFRETQAGLPTSLSDSGTDRLVFLKGDFIRDSTFFKNRAMLGGRDIATIDSGLGCVSSGTGYYFPLFNRYTMSFTRFIPLPPLPTLGKSESIVLHCKFGDCIGDVASYDYFTLGGPFSCRGYDIGELGSARSFLEAAVEFRKTLPKLNGEVYSFIEHANSLNSSKELRGDPNEFYRLRGCGTSWGYGIKFAAARFEYARDCCVGKGTLFVRFGDRF